MLNFKDFTKSRDTALDIRNAIDCCKEKKADGIVFPKDTYSIKKDYAYEKWLSVSNHGNGLKRIAFLLENMEDFTIDLSGSTVILEDVMIPFAIIGCRNVTIKNFKLRSLKPMAAEGVITQVRENGFSFRPTGISKIFVDRGALYGGERNGDND